ncbi:MAG: hypothetical protein ABDH49_00800 [Candidatus Hydrothermales bacterium]
MGVGVTLLAGAVGYMAWRNGKIIRESTIMMLQKIDEGFRRMDEGFRLIALFILAETKEEKRELAKRILGEKA